MKPGAKPTSGSDAAAALTGRMAPKLSASRLIDYLGCAHQSALWLGGVEAPPAVDETLELVRKKGFEHEALVLQRLERLYGPAVKIQGSGDVAERMLQTLAAINSGAALIYQAALHQAGWIGFPDFLVRKTGAAGARFEPEDAKLARRTKPEYVLQLGIYAALLEQCLGYPIAQGAIHVSGGEPAPVDLRRTTYILRRLMRAFEAFVARRDRPTQGAPCRACAQCDYQSRCDAEWRDADSPFFVAGLTAPQIVKLQQAGIRTLAELAQVDETIAVEGMGRDTLRKLSAQARLQFTARQTGAHAIELLPVEGGRGFTLLPMPAEGDLFFDMEGDPFVEGGLEYLFGLYGNVGPGGSDAFLPIWAHDAPAEKAAFERLIDLFSTHFDRYPHAHIFHYASYEPNALKNMAMRYATREAPLDQLLRDKRFVDLYRVITQGVRASTESYSLKALEVLYGQARHAEVKTAGASIVEYERWRETGDASILQAIEDYNREDCISTAHLCAWLQSLRPAGAVFGLTADAAEDRDRAAAREQRERDKQRVAGLIRASTVSEPRVRDLVAELLWFHQRSQKPGWWAVFDRQLWSDEELVADAECLGSLVLDTNEAPRRDKQSMETTYRFPPQDTKLKAGDTPKIAATLANAGSISDLSAEDGRIVLRRGIRSGAMPDQMSLIPAPLDQQWIPDAVLAFAERFAAGLPDPALLDILERRPPRVRTGAITPREPREEMIPYVSRIVADLDNSYLFVQGPPGTGKTYTLSFVVADLLAAGFRVGVTSNSHKAINKALEEVEKRMAERRVTFLGAKRANRNDPDTEHNGTHIINLYKSEDVSPIYRLVGGTVFHFSRDDQRGAFDYLFVDEAGQVSLGNLVAMGGAAKNIVLVGDQMQLPQPVQGVHPGDTGLSSLEYLLEGHATIEDDRGVFLKESRRLHPALCTFISEAIYDGRLAAHPIAAQRRLILDAAAPACLKPGGLTLLPVAHAGCTQSSVAEAEAIASLLDALCRQRVQREDGTVRALTLQDVLVVAPYNLQVNLLKQRLPRGVKVGTVDKFQGQEAAVVIVSMTTSRGEDAPRGTQFLFNRNRFNVAISRAECLAIVVHGAELLEGSWQSIEDLERLNLFAHAEAYAGARLM